ncbi:hypothetical protein JD844_000769 [Phrynosoma platyrhinos]|uniref:Peptidase M28 domain-containing protein n=1 Tax=Phrynosoma platyrhinos TaxID=52577 RepID=A0ABQ7T8J3_PHRPL|nr:hypothetical protein JD844_000769 [Phrynosoma platyrhinos]
MHVVPSSTPAGRALGGMDFWRSQLQHQHAVSKARKGATQAGVFGPPDVRPSSPNPAPPAIDATLFHPTPFSPSRKTKKPPRRSYTIYRNPAEADGEPDPEGLQMKVVESEGALPLGGTAGGRGGNGETASRWTLRWKGLAYVVLVVLFKSYYFRFQSFLLGYVSSRGSSCSAPGDLLVMANDESAYEAEDERIGAPMYWAELREMFQKYLHEEKIEGTIRKMSEAPHPAGSPRLDTLSRHVLDAFASYGLDHSWTDSHYVGLQRPNWRQPNFLHQVDANGAALEKLSLGDPDVYCPYSASGIVTVHMGAGDPYSPGFPSFNHTQFPPVQSSGLPKIPAHPISAEVAAQLLRQVMGPPAPQTWKGRLPGVPYQLGPGGADFRLKLGRDSLGPGAARSGVGTAILLELARTFTAMVRNGFQLRRSLLFVSWDAGDFGSVGSTEWLEGYLTMLHLKAAAYISLDNAVLGEWRLEPRRGPPSISPRWGHESHGGRQVAPANAGGSERRRQILCQDQPSFDRPH